MNRSGQELQDRGFIWTCPLRAHSCSVSSPRAERRAPALRERNEFGPRRAGAPMPLGFDRGKGLLNVSESLSRRDIR